MKNEFVKKYFVLIRHLLHVTGVLPEEVVYKSKIRTFLFNKVWPPTFLLFWVPLIIVIALKVYQCINNQDWADLLDIMPMYICGSNAVYVIYAIQKTAELYKSVMEKVEKNFVGSDDVGFKDFLMICLLCSSIFCSLVCYTAVSIYYGEEMVGVYVPYVDNDKPHPIRIYVPFLLYEGLAGSVMVIVYGCTAPFVIAITMLIIKEFNYLMEKLERLRFYENPTKLQFLINEDFYKYVCNNSLSKMTDEEVKEVLDGSTLCPLCITEADSKRFIRDFVHHHQHIISVIKDISRMHSNIFLTQFVVTVAQSCFMAFNLYYVSDKTERLVKVIIKSSPIFFFSYYILFIYCWNGQRLANTCERFFRALYECEWYNFPHSFKKSLLIIMANCLKPVYLTGGGISVACFDTFLTGLQQSFSYVLVLKELTPVKNK